MQSNLWLFDNALITKGLEYVAFLRLYNTLQLLANFECTFGEIQSDHLFWLVVKWFCSLIGTASIFAVS